MAIILQYIILALILCIMDNIRVLYTGNWHLYSALIMILITIITMVIIYIFGGIKYNMTMTAMMHNDSENVN